MRVLLGPFMSARPEIAAVVALACALSLLIGNLSAIPQTNIKRMLAYSGIAHAGYVLIGIAALSQAGAAASIFYLVQYVFANAGAFLVAAAVAQATGKEEIADYAGLAQRNPPLAFAMLLLLLSLGGIPPLAGFWAKVYVFVEAARSGLWWLVLLGALLSVVALYYYLMVVKQMYIFPAAQRDPVRVKWTTGLAIGICTAAVVIIGYPRPYVQAAQRAAADAIFRQPHAVRLVVRRTSQQPIAGDARTAGPTRSALPASPPAGAH
jgi:NADH-quinone oxidoreductase subunit N